MRRVGEERARDHESVGGDDENVESCSHDPCERLLALVAARAQRRRLIHLDTLRLGKHFYRWWENAAAAFAGPIRLRENQKRWTTGTNERVEDGSREGWCTGEDNAHAAQPACRCSFSSLRRIRVRFSPDR